MRTLIHTYSAHATCSGTEGVSLTLCSLHRPFSLFESAIVDMQNMRSEDQDLQEGLRRSLQESKQAITWRNDGTLARFQERLNLLGFTHTDVDGDGHCLFATMAQCLRNTEQGSMPMEDQPMHTWQSLRIQLSEDLRHSDNFKELLSMVPVQRFWVQYISPEDARRKIQSNFLIDTTVCVPADVPIDRVRNAFCICTQQQHDIPSRVAHYALHGVFNLTDEEEDFCLREEWNYFCDRIGHHEDLPTFHDDKVWQGDHFEMQMFCNSFNVVVQLLSVEHPQYDRVLMPSSLDRPTTLASAMYWQGVNCAPEGGRDLSRILSNQQHMFLQSVLDATVSAVTLQNWGNCDMPTCLQLSDHVIIKGLYFSPAVPHRTKYNRLLHMAHASDRITASPHYFPVMKIAAPREDKDPLSEGLSSCKEAKKTRECEDLLHRQSHAQILSEDQHNSDDDGDCVMVSSQSHARSGSWSKEIQNVEMQLKIKREYPQQWRSSFSNGVPLMGMEGSSLDSVRESSDKADNTEFFDDDKSLPSASVQVMSGDSVQDLRSNSSDSVQVLC